MSDPVDAFLAEYSPEIAAIARAACDAVKRLIPDAIEMIDEPAKMIAYGYDRTYKGMICAVAPFTAHVNLGFARGTSLADPDHLLEGTGKRARHVKLRSAADLERPALIALIEAAAIIPRDAG